MIVQLINFDYQKQFTKIVLTFNIKSQILNLKHNYEKCKFLHVKKLNSDEFKQPDRQRAAVKYESLKQCMLC